MKIALGLECPLALRGGVSVLVETLIEGLSGEFEITLVSADPPGFTRAGIRNHLHWDPAAVSGRASRQLAGRLGELGIELAHFHLGGHYGWGIRVPGQSPFRYLRRQGICCVTTMHMAISIFDGYCGPDRPMWWKLGLLPLAWLGKIEALSNIGVEITVSRQAGARARRWYWPLRNRFRPIYYSRLSGPQTGIAAAQREPLILCVGHFAWRKGQHTLAAAFAQLAAAFPAWKLAFIGPFGTDGCFAYVQGLVAEKRLQDRVLLLGSREDAFEFMRRAAIFVQPSLFEGLPLALQEAMYYGCACLATNVLGNEELIESGQTGLLVPPLQVEVMASALETLMRKPEERQKLGEAAAAAALRKEMTAEKMLAHHRALYHALCPGPAPCPSRADIG